MHRKREWSLWEEKVVLVPYSPHHVPKYHGWMQDPVLRFQTGSEPLSLEEEYEMQRKWLADKDKCTFICLERSAYEKDPSTEVECMVGDVNLFFNDPHNETVAELELMIAEPGYHRRGLGLEAARLMMAFGISELGVKLFRAKIGVDNTPSLQLFQDRLSFVEVSRSSVFQEISLELAVTEKCSVELYTAELPRKWRTYFTITILICIDARELHLISSR